MPVLEKMYDGLFVFAMCFLILIAFAYLLRAILGSKFSDRILAINGISTIVILIICIISVMQKESYIVDVALIYAMLGFVTVVIVCKAYLRSHHKERAQDFSNLKGEETNG